MKPWYISASASEVIQSSAFVSGFLKSRSYLRRRYRERQININ